MNEPFKPEVIVKPVLEVLVMLDGPIMSPTETEVEFPLYAVAVPRLLITTMKFCETRVEEIVLPSEP